MLRSSARETKRRGWLNFQKKIRFKDEGKKPKRDLQKRQRRLRKIKTESKKLQKKKEK